MSEIDGDADDTDLDFDTTRHSNRSPSQRCEWQDDNGGNDEDGSDEPVDDANTINNQGRRAAVEASWASVVDPEKASAEEVRREVALMMEPSMDKTSEPVEDLDRC